MVGVELAFLTVAFIIFIGYAGMLFFKRTKVSEILVLMIIGLLLGPVFGLVGSFEISLFEGFLPFFASFALMMILFEGGMQINFFGIIKELPGAFVFTVITFIVTLLCVSLVWFVFTGDFLTGLLIGAILGGTSSAIIIPLVNSTTARGDTKSLLGIESAITDALCVISAVTIAQIIAIAGAGGIGSINIGTVGASILGAFSIALVLGTLFGFLWINILSFFEKKPYEYLLTMAILLTLYSVAGIFGGNGAMAALVFGIILGNSEDLTRMLRLTPMKIEGNIKSFQAELSFMIRTLFFVYMGLLFKVSFLSDVSVVLIALLTLGAILFSRWIGWKIISAVNPVFFEDKLFIVTLCARGLAAAGLVSFPIIVSLYPKILFDKIVAIVFIVIFISNLATVIGVFISEKVKSQRSKLEKVNVDKSISF